MIAFLPSILTAGACTSLCAQERTSVQFITITFESAVTQAILPLVTFAQRNNGISCTIPATFFVSNNFTDYYATSELYYKQGFEIAANTMGSPDLPSSKEIGGSRAATAFYANIPFENITGFRAPFLHVNKRILQSVSNLGFEYDSSLDISSPTFPYRMSTVLSKCDSCNELSLPKLISVPLTQLEDNNNQLVDILDPSLNTSDDVFQLFKSNLENHQNHENTPFGLNLQPATLLTQPYISDGLNKFIDYAAICKTGLKLSNATEIHPRYVVLYANVDSPNTCVYGDLRMKTCLPCPAQYPTPLNPIPNDTDECHTTFPQVYTKVVTCQNTPGFSWGKEQCECLSPKCKINDPSTIQKVTSCPSDKPFSFQSCKCDDPIELFTPPVDPSALKLKGSSKNPSIGPGAFVYNSENENNVVILVLINVLFV